MKRYVKLKCNQCKELLKHKVTKISVLKHFLEKPCDKGCFWCFFSQPWGNPSKLCKRRPGRSTPWTLIGVQGECLVGPESWYLPARWKTTTKPHELPIPSMYGMFPYIWLIFMVNVGKHTSPMDPFGLYTVEGQDFVPRNSTSHIFLGAKSDAWPINESIRQRLRSLGFPQFHKWQVR